MDLLNVNLVDWSRAQFAMTAMYHWLFVPLTLGLGVIMAVMETLYVKTGKEAWKQAAKFWMTVFGINFAIGVATGIILEFEFGTNWSNYSWFVGDIFGAPLAIEGILAFFMEATFISIMFFGWKKVSKGMHLASTWLTVIGATLSALWILVANAWMQYPAGTLFNPDSVRNEMIDFWSILLSPVAVNKFFHTVTSAWVLGSVFVIGVSAWYLLKKRVQDFARRSILVASVFGLIASFLLLSTGHGSAFHVAQRQPMKLAAMEGLYEGKKQADLLAFGIVNPAKKHYADSIAPLLMPVAVPIPGFLSLLAHEDADAFVPGVKDIIDGGYYLPDGNKALSFDEKKSRGLEAMKALEAYRGAREAGDQPAAEMHKAQLYENYAYFGYGYLEGPESLIPNVPLVFYSFRIMVVLGLFFIALFIVMLFFYRRKLEAQTWLHWLGILSIPLAYLASQAGWIVAEVGRQPWAIQDVLPVQAAVSDIPVASVKLTFFLFLSLFTVLLVAEVMIMVRQIKKGPEAEN